jgi:hypothetical protein
VSTRPRATLAPPSLRSPAEWGSWVAAIVLTLSSFMGWYSISIDGLTLSVLGWHTGALGKLVFFVGLAAVALLALRATGFELPPAVPLGMALAGLGFLGTILAVIRLISIPDDFEPAGRSIGIWLTLLSGLALVAAGLVRSADDVARR